MNVQAPKQHAGNKPATCTQFDWTLFILQGYGAHLNHEEQIVSIPVELQANRDILEFLNDVQAKGWHVQIGIMR
ncbi:MAG: hypothetical protein N4A71_10970 [Carboxylicivirga sp.]|jgi:hypothetical protein|nr:hypothetical protein [Carboxylicivirga sp.]